MPSMNLYRQMSTLSKADPLEWGDHRVVRCQEDKHHPYGTTYNTYGPMVP